MDVKYVVAKELQQSRAARKECIRKLSGLPEGTLRAEKRNGKIYYRTRRDGKSVYVKREDSEIVGLLKERKRLETMVKVIDKNIEALQQVYDSYCPYSEAYIEKLIPESYRHDSACSKKIDGKYDSPEDWANAHYRKKEWKQNYRIPGQVTLKGDRVRSKSELTIANMLYTMGIPYHYEEEVVLSGIKVAPDFVIYVKSKNRFVILEHFGRMFDPGYQSEYGSKVGLYISNGYMPGRDLFMTYDDKDGNLDTKQIEELIEMYLM